MPDLPEIGGIQPSAAITAFAGKTRRLERALHLGDRVVLVIEAHAVATHELRDHADDGPVLHQRLKVEEVYELELDAAATLLRDTKARYRLEADEAAGRVPLAFDHTRPPEGYTDSSGVAMTTAEILEARGLPPDAGTIDAIVVEFEDGTRALWPDDWAGTEQSLAPVGGAMMPPGGAAGEEPVKILRWIDEGSGEPMDEWTDEDEDRALLAAEEAAKASEGAAEYASFIEDLEASLAIVGGLPDVEETLARTAQGIKTTLRGIDSAPWLQLAELKEQAGKGRKGVLGAIRDRLAAVNAADADGHADEEE